MYYAALLAIAAVLLFAFCCLLRLVGNGFRREVQGGPVIRQRAKRGIVRFPIDPENTRENYHL